MFDIGFSELLIVFVVGLLILGPERLPTAAKTAGLWVRKIRRSVQSVQREINAQLDQEELQQKITETNQRILKENAAMQNTIASSASATLEPISPIMEEENTDVVPEKAPAFEKEPMSEEQKPKERETVTLDTDEATETNETTDKKETISLRAE